jgi:hypothetical protein
MRRLASTSSFRRPSSCPPRRASISAGAQRGAVGRQASSRRIFGLETVRRGLTAFGAIVLAACSSDPPVTGGDDTAIVIGIQSESLGPDAKSAHVTATVDGATVVDQTIQATAGTFAPTEVKVAAPAVNPNAVVDVKVDVLAAEGAAPVRGAAPVLLTRLASTRFVPGQTKLLRVRLEQRCVSLAVSPGSIATGPTCQSPQTCISGRCADATVGPQDLEAFTPSWPTDAPDICRPANAGPPEVIVGSGQTDYMPLADGATLQMELGPQRGRHVWIAVRMRNIRQSGSTTTLTAVQPDTGLRPMPTAFVFTFDRDEGGYCKLYGLRFQLDAGGIDHTKFLGKPLDITVEVADQSGRKASATKRVMIDAKVLGEG